MKNFDWSKKPLPELIKELDRIPPNVTGDKLELVAGTLRWRDCPMQYAAVLAFGKWSLREGYAETAQEILECINRIENYLSMQPS